MSTFIIKKATNGEYYFNLQANNGETILSSELYKAHDSALNGIASVKKNATEDSRYELKLSTSKKPFFVLKAANHEVIGKSALYDSESERNQGIQTLKISAPAAETDDQSRD